MKIRVQYTIEVTDEFRSALSYRFGWDKPATREQLLRHYEEYGNSITADILAEFNSDQELKGAGP